MRFGSIRRTAEGRRSRKRRDESPDRRFCARCLAVSLGSRARRRVCRSRRRRSRRRGPRLVLRREQASADRRRLSGPGAELAGHRQRRGRIRQRRSRRVHAPRNRVFEFARLADASGRRYRVSPRHRGVSPHPRGGGLGARRARASGMKIVYHNRSRRPDEDEVEARRLSFEELLRTADCVVVLTPLTEQTRGLFGAAQFAAMKPSAYFVNAARGKIVDTQALYDALVAKRIAGAALDVVDPEPLPPDHPLLALPNVFVTPHIGSATHQTRERMSLYAARNLVAGITGNRLPQIVNPAVYEIVAPRSRSV